MRKRKTCPCRFFLFSSHPLVIFPCNWCLFHAASYIHQVTHRLNASSSCSHIFSCSWKLRASGASASTAAGVTLTHSFASFSLSLSLPLYSCSPSPALGDQVRRLVIKNAFNDALLKKHKVKQLRKEGRDTRDEKRERKRGKCLLSHLLKGKLWLNFSSPIPHLFLLFYPFFSPHPLFLCLPAFSFICKTQKLTSHSSQE